MEEEEEEDVMWFELYLLSYFLFLDCAVSHSSRLAYEGQKGRKPVSLVECVDVVAIALLVSVRSMYVE